MKKILHWIPVVGVFTPDYPETKFFKIYQISVAILLTILAMVNAN